MKKKKTLFRSKYCWLGEWNSILLMAKMKAFCVALSKVVCDARVSTFLLGWYSQRSAVNGHKISPLQSTIVTIITSTSDRRYKYPSSTHVHSSTGSRYVPQNDLDRECCHLALLPIFQLNRSRSKIRVNKYFGHRKLPFNFQRVVCGPPKGNDGTAIGISHGINKRWNTCAPRARAHTLERNELHVLYARIHSNTNIY